MPSEQPNSPTDDRTDVDNGGDNSTDEPGAGGSDSGATGVSESLVGLCRQHAGKLPAKQRAYRVKHGNTTRYTFSNSPGQAALAVCNVERVTDKELTLAAFEAMGVK